MFDVLYHSLIILINYDFLKYFSDTFLPDGARRGSSYKAYPIKSLDYGTSLSGINVPFDAPFRIPLFQKENFFLIIRTSFHSENFFLSFKTLFVYLEVLFRLLRSFFSVIRNILFAYQWIRSGVRTFQWCDSRGYKPPNTRELITGVHTRVSTLSGKDDLQMSNVVHTYLVFIILYISVISAFVIFINELLMTP